MKVKLPLLHPVGREWSVGYRGQIVVSISFHSMVVFRYLPARILQELLLLCSVMKEGQFVSNVVVWLNEEDWIGPRVATREVFWGVCVPFRGFCSFVFFVIELDFDGPGSRSLPPGCYFCKNKEP